MITKQFRDALGGVLLVVAVVVIFAGPMILDPTASPFSVVVWLTGIIAAIVASFVYWNA